MRVARHRSFAVVFLLTLLLGVACGDDDDTGSVASSTTSEPTQEQADRLCRDTSEVASGAAELRQAKVGKMQEFRQLAESSEGEAELAETDEERGVLCTTIPAGRRAEKCPNGEFFVPTHNEVLTFDGESLGRFEQSRFNCELDPDEQ